jgi:fused signal recognition particle receptor
MNFSKILDSLGVLVKDSVQQLTIWWQDFILWVARQFAVFAAVLESWGVPQDKSLVTAYAIAYTTLGVLFLLFVWRLLFLRRRNRIDAAVRTHKAPEPGKIETPAPGVKEKPADVAPESAAPQSVTQPELSVYERLRNGLAKTHKSLFGKLDTILGSGKKIGAETLEEIEEVLVSADFGVKTTQRLIDALERRLTRGEMQQPEQVRMALREEVLAVLTAQEYTPGTGESSPYTTMVVGVNGVGKTTTIGKLAHQYRQQGKKVVLGAADTFRAAAADQLVAWGERADVAVVRHSEGADPAAVAYDAAKAAVAREVDILIIDTAGRLHTKVNLMEEMKKIRRVLGREIDGAPHETLLVLDATTGQNALVQARLFQEAVAIDGIILTKLDGTARGGMAVAIAAELQVPVRYIGVGEGVEDLRSFDPEMFVDALFENH